MTVLQRYLTPLIMSVADDAIPANARSREQEIERLQELLRSVGANRYWEGRWRDEYADNERLREALRLYVSSGYCPTCENCDACAEENPNCAWAKAHAVIKLVEGK